MSAGRVAPARTAAILILAASCVPGAAVPTPESYFGHRMGADRAVLDWDRVVSYFRALQKGSDRLIVKELGKSTEGRPFLAVTIASAATLRRLDRYMRIQQKLADPRITSEREAERVIDGSHTISRRRTARASARSSTRRFSSWCRRSTPTDWTW